MHAIVSLGLLIAVAAITPGPNNFLVLAEAAGKGLAGALPVIAAVAAGGAAMLVAGSSLVEIARLEPLLPLVGLLGAGMLAFMAVAQWRSAGEPPGAPAAAPAIGPATIALLQPANPKAWILVAVVLAGTRAAGLSISASAMLFAAISLACSLCWGLLGRSLARSLEHPRRGPWIRRGLAAALLATALHLSFSQFGVLS